MNVSLAHLVSTRTKRWLLGAVLAGCVAAAVIYGSMLALKSGTPIEQDGSPPLFADMTDQSGIHFTARNGAEADQYTLLESLGSGLALIDYDGDGLLDIFLLGGGHFEMSVTGDKIVGIKGYPCKLYKNLGNWKFKDVTKEAGLDKLVFYSHGCAVADYDRDGWPDLLITGWGRLVLLRNVAKAGGGRAFQNVTVEAGLGAPAWATSAAWADLKGSGFPDLYVCQYASWSPSEHPHCHAATPRYPREICSPKLFKSLEHLLFRNNGDGTFTSVGAHAGLNVPGQTTKIGPPGQPVELGKGLGVIALDLNNDGRPDIYVANDTSGNFLYMNRFRRGFFCRGIRLEEDAARSYVAVDNEGHPSGSMGVTAGDYTGNGFASIFVTNFAGEMHSLYCNHGKERFTFESAQTGILAIGQSYVGFGTTFIDLENRGWDDIIISNGHVLRHPSLEPLKQRPVLFRNEEGKRFEEITSSGGDYFRAGHLGRGLAVGDLDNDGRSDVVIGHLNDPMAILRNIAGDSGTRNHWLGLDLRGRGNRDIVGTRVVVEAGGRKRTRFVVGGGSYMSASDPRQIFGLGDLERVERVTVHWSWTDKGQVFDGARFKVDAYWRLEEAKQDIVSPVKLRSRRTD